MQQGGRPEARREQGGGAGAHTRVAGVGKGQGPGSRRPPVPQASNPGPILGGLCLRSFGARDDLRPRGTRWPYP